MTAITFYSDDESTLQKLLNFAKQLNIRSKIQHTEIEYTDEQIWVQRQLTEKYVKTGEWDTMDDEDRQDAALGEMMLYAKMQPDYEIYSETETKSFLANLKQDLYALSGQ